MSTSISPTGPLHSRVILDSKIDQIKTSDLTARALSACGVKRDVVNLLTEEVLPENGDLILDDHRAVWLDISEP